MIALNQTINWQPESTGTGRFGQWLNNLNDWNLSRSRYWGTPLPIWRTEDGKEEICIGSIAELFDEIEKSVKAGFMQANPWPKHKVGDYSKANYDPSVIDLHSEPTFQFRGGQTGLLYLRGDRPKRIDRGHAG